MIKKATPAVRLFCKGLEIDERTREYIGKRVKKIEKFLKTVLEYEIEISKDKYGKFRVETMIKTPYKTYRAEETSESIEGSIDMLMDGLSIQIIRDKDRVKDLKMRGARSIKKKVVVDSDARVKK